MKIKIRVTMDLVGCERLIDHEVDDDMTIAQIDAEVREVAIEQIEWTWERDK